MNGNKMYITIQARESVPPNQVAKYILYNSNSIQA